MFEFSWVRKEGRPTAYIENRLASLNNNKVELQHNFVLKSEKPKLYFQG